MKWIPALVFVVGLTSCEQQPAKPKTLAPPPDAGAATNSGPQTNQETVEPDPSFDENAQFTHPFLYKVTKEGNHRESWLFGTVNAKFDVEFDRCPLSVRQALTRSDYAMFEVPTGSAAQRARTKLMVMTDGSLKKEIGRERFKKVIEVTKQSRSVLDVMKPWVVYMALEQKLSGDPPMEELFEGFAQSYRKRLVYLETVPEQVAVLNQNIDFETLGGLVDNFDAHAAAAAAAAEAYKVGDDDKIKAAIFPPDDKRGKLYEKLIDARIENWAGKLMTQFAGDETLAVVSIRYLVGPNNLISALQAGGWKVERVSH